MPTLEDTLMVDGEDLLIEEESIPEVPKEEPTPAPVKKKFRGRKYTFEQWAKRRGVLAHHKGGLRAYVANVNKPRTLEDWDECFKDY